ncbi:arginine methyl transferase [Favolaschia claudopus]|uniref:Arginine methyl transferase n=1 Tax=Favolaschia claudopus TaxID=2862362 RepID=A0AAW0DYN0_9AGAR
MAGQFAATRDASGKVVLYLSPTRPAPISVPFELREEITPDVWAGRLDQITQAASRYYKPIFERVWAVVAFLSIVIVPMALFRVILDAMHGDDHTLAHINEARGITFAISVGMIIFFLVPIAIWKYIGQKQVNAMLKQWERADRTGRGSLPMSTWKVKTPGLIRSNIVLTIQLPPGAAVTSFHVNAYLPSYINPPVDADANYYYPYKPEPGLPRMSVIGNVPLFKNNEKREFYGSEKV